MKKRVISILILVAIIFPMFQPICMATDTTETLTENGYEYTENSAGKIVISKYIGTETEVVIPNTINGKPVYSIGEEAFKSCKTITSVTVPGEIYIIDTGAFEWCSNLETVIIQEGVRLYIWTCI